MEISYKVTKNSLDQTVIVRSNPDGSSTSFMADPANSDYQAYLKSLNEPSDKL